MNEQDKWQLYEYEKQALQAQDLTAEEYEQKIREITERHRL